MLGDKLNDVLLQTESDIVEHEQAQGGKPNYSIDAFRASIKIFISAVADKIYELKQKEGMSDDVVKKMAQKAGEDVRAFIKTYTDIEVIDLFSKN